MGASPRRFDEPLNVAVVGAGAAGLVTAYELLAAGHRVTVFEQSDQVGGLWNYTEDTEDDPLGQQPSVRIHGSLYASLRVNLPRDLMAFEAIPSTMPAAEATVGHVIRTIATCSSICGASLRIPALRHTSTSAIRCSASLPFRNPAGRSMATSSTP